MYIYIYTYTYIYIYTSGDWLVMSHCMRLQRLYLVSLDLDLRESWEPKKVVSEPVT